jgi:hypothetical protein
MLMRMLRSPHGMARNQSSAKQKKRKMPFSRCSNRNRITCESLSFSFPFICHLVGMNETNHRQQQRWKKRKKLKKIVISRKFVLTRGATFYLPIGSSLVCLQHRQLLDRFPEGELSHSLLSLYLSLSLSLSLYLSLSLPRPSWMMCVRSASTTLRSMNCHFGQAPNPLTLICPVSSRLLLQLSLLVRSLS